MMNARSVIQNAVNPVQKGAIVDSGSLELSGAGTVYVQGKYAYITGNGDDGLEIVDISNPANPIHVGAIADNGTT